MKSLDIREKVKSFDFRKNAGAVAAVGVLAGVFGVHAAAGHWIPDQPHLAAQSVTIEGRDDTAAARSAVRIKTAAQVLSEKVSAAQLEAADLDHYRVANIGVANGTLNKGDLCKLSWTNKSIIRCDAANSFEHLNEAFHAQFGYDIEINDSYRSLEKQVQVRKELGKIAAVPGYSNHGMGVALDLGSGIPDADSPQHQWMVEHAGDFGWVNPDWAKTTKIEPWHWEFAGFDN